MTGDGGAGDAVVLIFVRAPERGRVKTRLAADIGENAALAVYERLGRKTVDAARALGGAVRVRVCHTPDEAGDAVAAWLGGGVEYRGQRDGDLGARMARAFADAFAEGAERVLIVGSDLPGLTPDLLRDALALLDDHAAVLGPARDGGYYLLGLRQSMPDLFRDVPWSTDRVLEVTLERFAAAGITPAMLPELNDVDTADDLPEGWIEGERWGLR
jgi:uncharacterized protein